MKKIFGSKKSMNTFTVLSAAVLMAVILIILITFLWRVSAKSDEQALDQRCRTSVISYAKLNSLPSVPFHQGSNAKASDIDCPTRFVTIKKKLRPNEKRKLIADLMYKCWWQFGEGRLRLFRADSKQYCHMCAMFQFEDKTDSVEGMPFYLMTQRLPLKRDNRYPTYYEFITGNMPSNDLLEKVKSKGSFYFTGDKRYAVFFTFMEPKKMSAFEKFLVGVAAGAVVGLAVGVTIVTGGAAAPGIIAAAGTIAGSSTVGALIIGTTATQISGGGGSGYKANIIVTPYDAKSIKQLGCSELGLSMIDKKFR